MGAMQGILRCRQGFWERINQESQCLHKKVGGRGGFSRLPPWEFRRDFKRDDSGEWRGGCGSRWEEEGFSGKGPGDLGATHNR